MTNAATPTTPAGWYPDPAGSARSRWWDGAQWTEHYYDAYSGAPAEVLSAPAGTAPYTPWIWLMIFVPLLPIVGLFSFDLNGYMQATLSGDAQAMMSALFTPGYVISIVLGWVVYGLTVLFAFLDWKELKRREVPRPFHWAFAFIPYPVYVIGRSVVVRRRTGRGIAPMWVTIVLYVLIFIGSLVWVSVAMTQMMQILPTYIQPVPGY